MSQQSGSLFKNAPLTCPNCGDTSLHPQTVNVYCRQKDGSEAGIKTEVSAGVTTVTSNMEGSPCKWGTGIVITFNCDTCDYESKIVILEQAGQTFFSME
jgi:hypothetical protein